MSIGKNGMAGRAREGLFPFVPQGFGLFHLEWHAAGAGGIERRGIAVGGDTGAV